MSEQTTVNQTTVGSKTERSAANQSCRLSYDCLMSSSKTFLHHFSLLKEEEKGEYKSLGNYVKQLSKCMDVIKKNSNQVKRTTLLVNKVASASTVEAPVEASQLETSTTKSKKNQKKVAKEEQSPTAQVAASVVNEQKKTVRGKKVEIVQPTEVVEQVSEPVKKTAAPKKSITKQK
jgi:hypothetical protein